jgi:hypothetical protein
MTARCFFPFHFLPLPFGFLSVVEWIKGMERKTSHNAKYYTSKGGPKNFLKSGQTLSLETNHDNFSFNEQYN